MRAALAGVAQWSFGAWVSFPVKGLYLGCRFDPGPGQGAHERHPINVSGKSPVLRNHHPSLPPTARPGHQPPLICFLSPRLDAAADGGWAPTGVGTGAWLRSLRIFSITFSFKLTKPLF